MQRSSAALQTEERDGTPEKSPGRAAPSHATSGGSGGTPPRVADLISAGRYGAGASARARIAKSLQRTVGNARINEAVHQTAPVTSSTVAVQRDVQLPDQPNEKTAKARFWGKRAYFNYFLRDEIQWHLNPFGGLVPTFDFVLLLRPEAAKRLTAKQVAETGVAVLADGIGVPFRSGPQGLVDHILGELDKIGWPPESSEEYVAYRFAVDIVTIRQQFEEKAFEAWWEALKQTLGMQVYAGPLIAAGNFASGKATGKAPGHAAGGKSAGGNWAREQEQAVTRLIEDAKRQTPRPKDLPDRVVAWHNDRDQGWYFNVWVSYDPTGSKKTAWPVRLRPGETAEETLERVRAATQKAVVREEDRGKRERAQLAPAWAQRIERALRRRVEQLRARESGATDLPDGMVLVPGPDVHIQIWVERGTTEKQRNSGTVPLTPQSSVDQLLPYVRHLSALLREFENQPDFEVTPAGTGDTALAAFPAKIKPLDLREDKITVTGANNEFHMELNYEAVYGGGPLKDLYIASKLYSQAIRFFWKMYKVPGNVPLPEGQKSAPEDWGRRWQWLYDSYNNAPRDEHGKPKITDPGIPVYERSSDDSNSRVRIPDAGGDYLIRCTTGHAAIGEHKLKRVSSDAWYPVRVKPIREVGEAATSLRPAAIRALEEELKSIEKDLAGEQLDPHERQMLLAKQQIKKGDLERIRAKEAQTVAQNTAADIAYASGMLAKVKELRRILPGIVEQAKAKKVSPSDLLAGRPELVTVYWYTLSEGKTPEGYQKELEEQILQLGRVRKRAAEFGNEMKGSSPYQYAPEVAFVSKVTGHVYPLTMMLGEAPDSIKAGMAAAGVSVTVAYSLIDITSKQTQKRYRGMSQKSGKQGHIEAINRAFEDFGEDATYGEGILAVRIPAGAAGAGAENHPGAQMRYYRSKEGILQKVLWALGVIAAVAGVAALAATGVGAPAAAGVLGAVAAVAGAVTSIHALSERASKHTLEWDAETVMDIIGIIGLIPVAGATRTLRATLGVRSVICSERFLQIYSWTEAGATAILVPTRLAQDMERIHKMQQEGDLTAEQAEEMIRQARQGALQGGLMLLGGAVAARAGAQQQRRGSPAEAELAFKKQIEMLEMEGVGKYKSMEERGWIDKEGHWTDQAPEIVRPKPAAAEAGEGKPAAGAREEKPPAPPKEEKPPASAKEEEKPAAPKEEEKPPTKAEAEEKPTAPAADEPPKPARRRRRSGAEAGEGQEAAPAEKRKARPKKEKPPPTPKPKSKKQLQKEQRAAEREARVQAEIEAYKKEYEESKARQEELKRQIAEAEQRYEKNKAEVADLSRQLKEAAAAKKRGEDPDVDTAELKARRDAEQEALPLDYQNISELRAKLKAEIVAGEGVTPERYKKLRDATPSGAARKEILDRAREGQKVKRGQGVDEVFGTPATEANPLEPDHIVPVKDIVKMKGFNRIPPKKQVEVLNLRENLIAMNKSANASKRDTPWPEWEGWKQFTNDPEVRKRMVDKDAELRVFLQKEIEKRVPR